MGHRTRALAFLQINYVRHIGLQIIYTKRTESKMLVAVSATIFN